MSLNLDMLHKQISLIKYTARIIINIPASFITVAFYTPLGEGNLQKILASHCKNITIFINTHTIDKMSDILACNGP